VFLVHVDRLSFGCGGCGCVCVCVLFEWVEAGVSTVLCAIVSSGDCKLDGGIIASLRVRVG
jgi:hypothetical protein